MKEQLAKLASKAGFDVSSDGKFGNYSQMYKIEKFAELIVRECAKFLDENSGYDDCNNAWHPEPEDLLQHFGVTNKG